MAFGLLGLAVSSASAQSWGRPPVPRSGACFYQDINFGGQYFCARVGETAPEMPKAADDEISSVRVFGNAEVVAYRDSNFRGKSIVLGSDESDLRRVDMNDRITSYRVGTPGYGSGANWGGGGWGGGGNPGGGNWGRPPVPDRGGVCFYKSRNFEGDYFCSRVGDSASQVPSGTNDKISSIRIFGNAEVTVFRDIRYQGDSRAFDSNMPDLRRAGWNDLISSYRVTPGRSWGGGGAFGGGGGGNWSGSNRPPNSGYSYQEAEAVVRRAYRSVLGREPDEGARGYVNALVNDSWTEQRLIAVLRDSQEYRDKQKPR